MSVNVSAKMAIVNPNKITRKQIEEKLKVCGKWDRVFANVNMSGLDLSGLDFHDATFLNVTMDQTVFKNADLHSAHFYDCYINHADFTEADLTKAILANGQIMGSTFEHTMLNQTRWYGMALWDNRMENAGLKEAIFLYADLADCSFDGSDLHGAQFSVVNYDYTSFAGACCREACFAYETRRDYADFNGADVEGARMIKEVFLPVEEALKEGKNDD